MKNILFILICISIFNFFSCKESTNTTDEDVAYLPKDYYQKIQGTWRYTSMQNTADGPVIDQTIDKEIYITFRDSNMLSLIKQNGIVKDSSWHKFYMNGENLIVDAELKIMRMTNTKLTTMYEGVNINNYQKVKGN